MRRAFWNSEQMFLLFYHLIMNNIFRVQRYKHIAAAKPARQKKVAEQSGNTIRRMIDIRSKLARSEHAQHTYLISAI